MLSGTSLRRLASRGSKCMRRCITTSESSTAPQALKLAERGTVGIIGLPFNKGQVKRCTNFKISHRFKTIIKSSMVVHVAWLCYTVVIVLVFVFGVCCRQGRIKSLFQPHTCIWIVKSPTKTYFTHKKAENRVKYRSSCKTQPQTSQVSNHQPQIFVWGVQYVPDTRQLLRYIKEFYAGSSIVFCFCQVYYLFSQDSATLV